MIQNLKKIKDKVRYLLERNDKYKDNINYLIAGYYYHFHNVNKEMTAMQFLENLSNGIYPNPDDIARVRRKLQENFPELRGKNYQKNQSVSETVKKEIHTL